jgi:hypothetical protein
MVGFRQPPRREQRREWWRRQFSRQQTSNLTVAEFCRQLGVSVPTFYYWKKRVAAAAPDVPVRNSAQHRSRTVNDTTDAMVPSFMPVTILDLGAGTQLEIALANTCVVRLKGAVDASLLQAAIVAAGQLKDLHRGAN